MDNVIEELSYRPNSGLVSAMQHITGNLPRLEDQLNDMFYEEDMVLDCPRQIEFHSRLTVI